MSFGSGGNSDQLIAQQQQQDQQDQQARAAAIARLNAAFGIAPSGSTGPAPSRFVTGTSTTAGGGPTVGDMWSGISAPRTTSIQTETLNPAFTAWQANQNLSKEAAANAKNLQALYDYIGSGVRNYYTRDLNDQNAITTRNLKFELARRGQLGGSEEIDQNAQRQQLYDRRLLDIANLGDQAIANAQTADNTTRLNAVRDINAGVDANSAIQGALSQMQLNRNNATAQAEGANLGDAFANLAYLYNTRQNNDAITSALARYRSQFTPSSGAGSGSSYQGTTS